MLPHWLRKRITGHMLWQYPDLGAVTLAVFVVFLGLGTILPVLTIYAQGRGITVAEIGYRHCGLDARQLPVPDADGLAVRPHRAQAAAALRPGRPIVITLAYLAWTVRRLLIVLRFFEGMGGAASGPPPAPM